jgi:disulfide bond formation protein DsbB|tara:strand:+ start:152 stop:634 length:483 start_codon:yes stop_codon:yes gene_type:complete
MLNIKKYSHLHFILIFSIFALSFAYFVELVLNHKPCNLCLLQRIPYVAAILLISLIFILNKHKVLISKIIIIFFMFGALISFYHLGIEQGFFTESFVCLSDNDKNVLSATELLKELKNTKISCKNVGFTILGISLATLNTIISLGLSVIIFLNLKNNENK